MYRSDFPFTKDEARRFLRTRELPDMFESRVKLFLQLDSCTNCDERKCMGCIFREYDHDCKDDCPFCCEEKPMEFEYVESIQEEE